MKTWAFGQGLVLLIIVLCAAGQVSAQLASECGKIPGLQPVDVRMKLSPPQIEHHHEVDLLGLPRIDHSVESNPPGGKILGLTLHGEGFKYSFEEKWTRQGDGPYCHYLTKVEGQLTLTQMMVYVASNYPVGSCEYKVVLEHENTHVRITRDMIDRYSLRLENALRSAARRISPLVTVERSGVEQISQRLNAELEPLMKQFREDTARANAVIDTPENYRKTTARCSNW